MSAPNARPRAMRHAPSPTIFVPFDVEDETLAECVGPDRHLQTLCACGDQSAFDPEVWIARGLGRLPMTSFSGRLRCPCGRRHAQFQVWPGTLAEGGLKVRSAAALYD